MREGLRLALRQEADFEVVGEAGDGRTALEQAERLQPHVVVMDIGLPDMSGLAAIRAAQMEAVDVRRLVVSTQR